MYAQSKLRKRLQTVAGMVTPGNRVADIGTDHAYLPIYLVETGLCPGAIGLDVRPGPLARAKKHCREAGLTDRIDLRLSDGFAGLKAGEADTVIITGMGGPLIRDILNAGFAVAKSAGELILSPQSDVAEFRRFLRLTGYRIMDEAMVEDGGKYYAIIKACWQNPASRPGCGPNDSLTLEDRFGPILLQKKPAEWQAWILEKIRIDREIEGSILQAGETEKNRKKLALVREDLTQLRSLTQKHR